MEIERKFLVKELPNLQSYEVLEIEQGYLCTAPVLRIRRQNEDYILTYKSKGMLSHEEYNLALNRAAYEHLRSKTDGNLIRKKRYLIPLSVLENNKPLIAELDVFEGIFQGLIFVEVEFSSEEYAKNFIPPEWFGEDVTYDIHYRNSFLSSYQVPSNEPPFWAN